MNIHTLIAKKIQQALIAAGAPEHSKAKVRQSAKPSFGHYQANGMMCIAKKLGLSPHTLAKKVVAQLELTGIAQSIEIAGPGFINIFLDQHWLVKQLNNALNLPRLGIAKVVHPQTIIVDYSAPNVAKEMHIGHMRSTIIGDASVRTLAFLGHNVIRANHIGDWGTQFGMLIAYMETVQCSIDDNMPLSSLENCYLAAKNKYDDDPNFAELARSYVVKLHGGNNHCRQIWRKLVDVTLKHNQKTYDRLNVTLTCNDVMGESLYNNMLPSIIDDLKAKGLAINCKGATVVFLNEFKNKKGEPMGVVIQKKDGAYLYTTTDIACLKYRYENFKADRIIYYIDARQHQHLMQIWTIVRKAGYLPKSVILEHHMFGMMLDHNGKPFKTRAGGTIKLVALLDEALERTSRMIENKNPNIDATELKKIAQIISIGAVKYADLSKHRTTDYIFDWDQMLSLEGNTAPYIQYAYTRIISLLKRSGQYNKPIIGDIMLVTEQEKQLAIRLLQLEETITTVAQEGTPHILCSYLYNLAVIFSLFYEHCLILNADSITLRQSRLQLALLTARTLKQGLDLLGIETVDKM